MSNFQKRIQYQGDLAPLLQQVCDDFTIGTYTSHAVIPIGYEDFNIMLSTNKDDYFVKIFASFRDADNCKRYVKVIRSVLDAGVSHPALYKSSQGYLYNATADGSSEMLCVMEHIEGKNFYELQSTPTTEETRFILSQVARINSIAIRPAYVYDNWAVINFLEQYEKKKQYLVKEDNNLIAPLIEHYDMLSIKDLPHCFTHGDITKTNTIKGSDGKIRILDFAVSNYYPRIVELAALLSDLFFDHKNMDSFMTQYQFVLDEYQKHIVLTPDEVNMLPLFVKLTHAMHVLCANYDKIVLKNISEENMYYLRNGRLGLEYTTKIWP